MASWVAVNSNETALFIPIVVGPFTTQALAEAFVQSALVPSNFSVTQVLSPPPRNIESPAPAPANVQTGTLTVLAKLGGNSGAIAV